MGKADNKININVDPLQVWLTRSVKKIESKIDPMITDFINSFSYQDFILAGNSVANMIENIKIKGDLDFWVTKKEAFMDILEEFRNKNPLVYDIYPSMILMKFTDLPDVNLILSDTTAENTVRRFDFDYCRCYYTKHTGYMASEECLNSIFTRTIRNEISYASIRPNRIFKAMNYGYLFNQKFWSYHSYLLKSKEKIICNICRIKIAEKYYCKHPKFYKSFIPIQINDLKLDMWFRQEEIDIKLTDVTNIDNTINELEKIFSRYHMAQKTRLKLPKLLSFSPDQFDFVKTYVARIIMFNPVSNGNYLDIAFCTRPKPQYYDHYKSDDDEDDEKVKIPPKSEKTSVAKKKASKSSTEDEETPKNKKTSVAKKKAIESPSESEEEEDEEEDEKEDEEEPPKKIKTPNSILNYDHNDNPHVEKIIYLNHEKTAYLKINYLPDELKKYAINNFDEMFGLHPVEKHKIIMYLNEVEVNRWQQCYLKTPGYEMDILKKQSYMYSGFDVSNNNKPLPKQFQIYYDYMKLQDDKYNQVVVNWYQDENDYIAPHNDCEIGMIPNAEISIASLYGSDPHDSTCYRILNIIPKNENITAQYQKINIVLRHGLIITMGGNTQKEFKHGIEKTKSNIMSRISLSFRQFME